AEVLRAAGLRAAGLRAAAFRAGAFAAVDLLAARAERELDGDTAAASFSRALSSDLFAFCASRLSVLSAAAVSLYAVRVLLPRSSTIVVNALLASSSAFSKRAVACSTSRRVAALADVLLAVVRRGAAFFAAGMTVLLLFLAVDRCGIVADGAD